MDEWLGSVSRSIDLLSARITNHLPRGVDPQDDGIGAMAVALVWFVWLHSIFLKGRDRKNAVLREYA